MNRSEKSYLSALIISISAFIIFSIKPDIKPEEINWVQFGVVLLMSFLFISDRSMK